MQDIVNVLVLNALNDVIVERLKSISPRLRINRKMIKSINDIPADVWATVDVLYTSHVLPEPEAVPRLRWVQTHSAGVDQYLGQPLLAEPDLILTTTSGIHATTMAEYAFALILAFARKVPTMLRWQKTAEWPADRFPLFSPRELRGSVLGILGYGSIGREIARLAKAFGMEVLATKRDVMHPAATNEYALEGTGDPDAICVDRLYPPEASKSMVALCDFVVVLIPLTPQTAKSIDTDTLAVMKKTAVLINIARGGVVDEEALIKALQTGQIAGAGLDVFTQEPLPGNSPLYKLDNVILTPHIAGFTDHYDDSTAEVFARNLQRFLDNKDLLNRVDLKRGY